MNAVGIARCRACGHEGEGRRHQAREMMLGLREVFAYHECGACGTLQIVEVPGDLARFYPKAYYSYSNKVKAHYSWVERYFKHARARYWVEGRGVVGRLFKNKPHWAYFDWFREAGIGFESSILDVGAGRGDYLLRFASDGFRNVSGIDPYLEADVVHPNGVKVLKRGLEEMTGRFDCVWMHHSLEHFAEPAEALKRVAGLLKPGGAALIAVPLAGCWAWREFGVNWFQLDAPRHLVVPSVEGMRRMAGGAGLTVQRAMFDSRPDQIRFSVLYGKDIGMEEALRTGAVESSFTREQMEEMERKVKDLNERGEGDQACFVLRKGAADHK